MIPHDGSMSARLFETMSFSPVIVLFPTIVNLSRDKFALQITRSDGDPNGGNYPASPVNQKPRVS
jgi:hypothetical protein